MNFVIALRWNPDHTLAEKFQCVGLDRKKNLTEPFILSRAEVINHLQEGQVFQVMEKISCRWEMGSRLEVFERKGKLFIGVEGEESSSLQDTLSELPVIEKI